LCTTAVSPTISFATRNPEGRKGRKPTTVRISRSAETLTRGRGQAVSGRFTGRALAAITVLTGLFKHPSNPPPAARDTAATFAFRRKIRRFMVPTNQKIS
jgi:hypothetical protein